MVWLVLLAACNEYGFESHMDPAEGDTGAVQPFVEPEPEAEDWNYQPDDGLSPPDVVEDPPEPPEDTGEPPNTDQPIAVCTVNPGLVSPPFEEATFDGTASYDPSGNAIVDWDWTLVAAPAGSTSAMPMAAGPNRSGFLADLAGLYDAELVVTTDDGRVSAPCLTTLKAVPSQDFWVEMYWAQPNDDMDLHLLRPGGSYNSGGDCYWANCTGWSFGLDWGMSGDPTDDPRLDLDDIPGTGPENINIDTPATGTYTVSVHDFPGTSFPGANDVTVNIYIGGVLSWTDTRTITGEDVYEPFATVEWPSALITPL